MTGSLVQALVEQEMAWTSWEDSCKQPAIMEDGDLRECRRGRGHGREHASGFGARLRMWSE